MKAEQITVVMPVYNASRFLRDAVESVLKQTYQNLELLLIDDCSTDNSLEIAREYEQKDARVRVIAAEHNSGVANVRNRGIQEANGQYIALLDSDDVWTEDKLERQLQLVKKTNAKIVYCSYDFIDENNATIKKPFIVPSTTDYKKMLASSVISCSTALLDAELLKEHPFKPEFYHEDYVLWMELLSIQGVTAVGDTNILAHYRQVSGSRSNNKGNAAKERWNTYRQALGLNFCESVWAFVRYAIKGVLKYYM